MEKLLQLQKLQNELMAQFCKDSEYTLECLFIEQQMKEILKQLRTEKLNILPTYI